LLGAVVFAYQGVKKLRKAIWLILVWLFVGLVFASCYRGSFFNFYLYSCMI
jgi:hypothetical protein